MLLVFSPAVAKAKGSIVTPTPTLAPEEEEYDFVSMTTYEMFWPLVAGKVPGDRFYGLKVWRDKLMYSLLFGSLKKSEYLKKMANKRLLEVEKLVELNRNSYLESTLKTSFENLNQGLTMLKANELTPQAWWLTQEYQKDFEKHNIVAGRLKEKVSEAEKKFFEDYIKNIKSLTPQQSAP